MEHMLRIGTYNALIGDTTLFCASVTGAHPVSTDKHKQWTWQPLHSQWALYVCAVASHKHLDWYAKQIRRCVAGCGPCGAALLRKQGCSGHARHLAGSIIMPVQCTTLA